MKKKNNLFRIIWIVGVYAILITILYLVVIYKVQWENKDLNDYLYFYDCNNYLCTSIIKQDEYISKIKCDSNDCPYIKEKNSDIVILSNNKKTWMYNYQMDKIVSDGYVDYKYIVDDYYIATNNDGMQGIIDKDNNILVDFNYEYIKDYSNGYVIYSINDLYGIYNDEKLIDIECQYDDVNFINDTIFGYKLNNKYYIRKYTSDEIISGEYDYLYAVDDIILVVKDKKIDIINEKLSSMVLMKIDTYYEYTTEKERDSLKIYSDDSYVYFSVFVGTGDYKDYKYDLINNKLIS